MQFRLVRLYWRRRRRRSDCKLEICLLSCQHLINTAKHAETTSDKDCHRHATNTNEGYGPGAEQSTAKLITAINRKAPTFCSNNQHFSTNHVLCTCKHRRTLYDVASFPGKDKGYTSTARMHSFRHGQLHICDFPSMHLVHTGPSLQTSDTKDQSS